MRPARGLGCLPTAFGCALEVTAGDGAKIGASLFVVAVVEAPRLPEKIAAIVSACFFISFVSLPNKAKISEDIIATCLLLLDRHLHVLVLATIVDGSQRPAWARHNTVLYVSSRSACVLCARWRERAI